MMDKKRLALDESTLPKNWVVATLKEVTQYIQRGKGPKYIIKSELPVINQKCIRWFGIQKEYLKYVDPAQWSSWAKERYVQVGDILWNSTGTGTIGRAAIINHLAPGEKYVVDSHVTIVRPREINPKYIHFWIMSPSVQGSIEAMQSGSTNQVELSKKAIETLPIPVAPSDQQKLIVAEIEKQFSRLDEAVAGLKRVKANLKRYKAAVLKAAVEGKLTEEWRKTHPDVEPASKLLGRILTERRAKWEKSELAKIKEKGQRPKNENRKKRYKEAELPLLQEIFELPTNWVWTNLGQLSWSVKDGPHYSPKYSESGLPFISGGNIRPEGIDFSTAKYISPELHAELSERCKPEYYDLLYTKGGTTGIARINTEKRDFNVWVHVAVLKLVDSIKRFYLQHTLNSPHCYRQSQKYTHGVGNQDLGLTRMIWITVPLPPLQEQEQIVAEVEGRMSVIDKLEAAVEANLIRAGRLRQSILEKAFSGRLFPEDPDAESASVLLSRLKDEIGIAIDKTKPQQRTSGITEKEAIMTDLTEALRSAGGWIAAQEAFRLHGVADGADTNEVEPVYAELRECIHLGQIEVERRGEQDWLRLVESKGA